jgi:uncharacterized membrane protein
MLHNIRLLVQNDAPLDLAGNEWFTGFITIANAGTCFNETFPILVRNSIIVFLGIIVLAAIVMVAYIGLRFITTGGVIEKIQDAFQGFRNIFLGFFLSFLFGILILIILNYYIGVNSFECANDINLITNISA